MKRVMIMEIELSILPIVLISHIKEFINRLGDPQME
jgi:hypothetical protein